METTAVRLYGKNDLRLERFALPPPGEDEMLARVVSDSLCMSTYKAALQGPAHVRVPGNLSQNPVIVGHEFCGELVEVGRKWRNRWKAGDRFVVQPALRDPADPYATPGYSFPHFGGDATYVIIPAAVMERDCLLPHAGGDFFTGSLAEPVSCVIGGFRASHHMTSDGRGHDMGVLPGGRMALLAGAGPMGLCAVDYALHGRRRPSLLVVTDVDEKRLARAARIHSPQEAAGLGVTLRYVNTGDGRDVPALLRSFTENGEGFDDVFVYAPVAALVEQADAVLARGGCLNFFAGPTDPAFSARINFYNIHYAAARVVGSSGGDREDMRLALELAARGQLTPAAMITHVGGLDCAAGATLRLPDIPGGKKLIYTHLAMPLTALSELGQKVSPELGGIVERHGGLWSAEAERWLLKHGRPLDSTPPAASAR